VFTIDDGQVDDLELRKRKYAMNRLSFHEDAILKKLINLKMNKSPSYDNIHPKVLKNIKVVVHPFKKIFEESLASGILRLLPLLEIG